MKKSVGQTCECVFCARHAVSWVHYKQPDSGRSVGPPAATGIEFDKSGNAVFKQEELDQMARDDEEAKFRNAKPFLYAPGGPGEKNQL